MISWVGCKNPVKN